MDKGLTVPANELVLCFLYLLKIYFMKDIFLIRDLDYKEMCKQFILVKMLSPNIKQKDFKRMLLDMIKHGYRMVGVFDRKKCMGISGVWISTKLYADKYLEPDNVVIAPNYRSKGVGKLLMTWLEKEARKNGCKTILLDAYVENFSGHKFYYREGFVARGFHFLKRLK